MSEPVHLRSSAVSVVAEVANGVPHILHWGAAFDDLALPERWSRPPVTHGAIDVVAPLTVLPMHGDGHPGRPGLLGHRRGGRHWSPRFGLLRHEVTRSREREVLVSLAHDPAAQLTIRTSLTLEHDGVLLVDVSLANDGDSPYMLDAMTPTLPVHSSAGELLVFAGRWAREFHPQRFEWPWGAWTSENRLGRSSHEHPPYVFACENGTGEWSGRVWGVHVAHSGNHVLVAERLADDRRFIAAGELFHPGEMCVYPGETYSAPQLVAVYSDSGFTAASWALHREARRRRPRPLPARPVQINTWEAVYFGHDEAKLRRLADTAADVGVERFVLDDGWFGGRRNDRAGLGDWWVSPDVYPAGLAPLIAHVRSRGMGFGIWVEPEMVNIDSDLHRAHPEWVLATEGYQPVTGRHQLVLDLAVPAAFEHVLGQLDALLRDHDIEYVKWDMNRWHVQGSGADGKAGSHAQNRAFHRLLDELRRRHPGVEFESCASGGGRIDHDVLRRVERVWTSDSNDALERQYIQRGASMLIPPEVMGAHVGPDRSHSSGRRHTMAFRCLTAMFGHMGVEADLLAFDSESLSILARFIDLYRTHRGLIHGGDTVRFDVFDRTDGAAHAHGVYANDRSEALLAYMQLASAPSLTPPMWRLPGLDPERVYTVDVLFGDSPGSTRHQPDWFTSALKGAPHRLGGRYLAEVGLAPPSIWPESGILIRLVA